MTKVTVSMNRDTLLLLMGWINAHRPQGDWDPYFLTAALEAFTDACEPKPHDEASSYCTSLPEHQPGELGCRS